MFSEKIENFLDEVKLINWFEHCGTPIGKYYMIFSLFEAFDSWGQQHIKIWEPHIYALEDIAGERIGDGNIDEIFSTVSAAIGDTVWNQFGNFIDRQHLEEEMGVCPELFDMVKRDIAWACVESVLGISGFFTILKEIYKDGYFPCSWNGIFPSGQAVVL